MARALVDPSFAIRSRTEGNFFGCQEFEPGRLVGFSAAKAVEASRLSVVGVNVRFNIL